MSVDVCRSLPSQPGVQVSAGFSPLWQMQYAPKLSLFNPSDLSKGTPKKRLKIPTGPGKDKFSFLERVVEEDEEEKSPEPLPPLDGLRGAIGRARISRGIMYSVPTKEGNVSIQNKYNPDISGLFRRTSISSDRARPAKKRPKSIGSTSLPELSVTRSYLNSCGVPSQAYGHVPNLRQNGLRLKRDVRLRRSCLQVQPEVKELLDSFARCEPYREPVESDEQFKIVERAREIKSADCSRKSAIPQELQREKSFITDDKLDMVWTWLNTEDEEEKKKREEEDESWMYE